MKFGARPLSYFLGVFLACGMILFGVSIARAGLTGSAWSDGHGHIEIHYDLIDPMMPLGPKQLELHWHIGQGTGSTVIGLPPVFSQDFEPDELFPVVPLASSSHFLNPGGPAWNFVGAAPGAQLYVLPLEIPPPSVIEPRLGLASELEFSEWVGNLTLSFSLLNPAPGHFSVFDGDSTIPIPLYSSFGGTPASFSQGLGHFHHNYAFTAPGAYDIELTVAGTHVTDGAKSVTSAFQFYVGDVSSIPEPSAAWLAALAVSLFVVKRSRRG